MKENLLIIGKRLKSARLFHYLFAGGVAFIVEYATFLVLVYGLALKPGTANAIGFLCGLACSFTLNKLWVFGSHSKKSNLQLVSFFALGFTNLIVTTVLVSTLVAWGVYPYIAKIGLMVMVAAWNFIIFKKIIFRN